MFVCRRCAARLLDSHVVRKPSNASSNMRLLSSLSSGISEPRPDTKRVVASPHIHPQSISRLLSRQQYSTTLTTTSKPFRLAIIGSGPAGFYTASKVQRHHPDAKIDMYEKLPVPYGLVRFGVAPDHPEVKNCQDRFDEIAKSPNFEFIGNVNVGKDVPLEVLRRHYDAILFTYGASEDRLLGIPGEDLAGVWAARDFVAWYNGLPGYGDTEFNLKEARRVAIIGQGNVSLDVARILLTPVDDLRRTDIPEHVLQTLSESKVHHVSAIGRRGPLQAAFTIKEIRELTAIPSVSFGPIDPSFFPSDLKMLPRARRRIAELLIKTSKLKSTTSTEKSFSLQFLQAPAAFQPSQDPFLPVSSSTNPALSNPKGRLRSLELQCQKFGNNEARFDPLTKVVDSPEETVTAEVDLAFRSIGYKSAPLPKLRDLGVVFDGETGIIPNASGRAIVYPTDQPGVDMMPQTLPGLYVAGWVKRGPTGVIASTMEDAFATADCIAQDLEGNREFLNGKLDMHSARQGWPGVKQELRNGGSDVRRTRWKDWQAIDKLEKERGRKLRKEREKITNVEDMLGVLE